MSNTQDGLSGQTGMAALGIGWLGRLPLGGQSPGGQPAFSGASSAPNAPHWKRSFSAMIASLSLLTVPAALALDLSTANTAAQAHDASILATRAGTEAQRERVPMAQAQLFPNVSISGAYNGNVLDTTTTSGFGDGRDRYNSSNLALSVRQPLYRKVLWVGLEQAQAMVEDANASQLAEEQNLTVKVSTAYFEALLTIDQIKLIEAQRVFTTTQLDAARKALVAGTGTRTDIDEAQARLDMTQAQMLEAQQKARYTRRALEAMVQQSAEVLAGIDPARLDLLALKPVDLPSWIASAEANSPELQALSARLRSAELEVGKAQSGHWPTLDAVAQWSISDSENVTRVNTQYLQRSLGLQFSVPLYAGGYVNAQVRQAVAEQERYRQQLEAARRELDLRVEREYNGVTEGTLKVQALELAERSSAQLIDSTRKSQQAGVRTVIDVLNAEQQHLQVQRDLSQARHGYAVSLIRLWALAGQASPERIADVNGWLVQP